MWRGGWVSPDPTGPLDERVSLSNSERIPAAFEEHSVETNLIVMEGASHGFGGDDAVEAFKARAAWFVAHLGGGGAVPPDGN